MQKRRWSTRSTEAFDIKLQMFNSPTFRFSAIAFVVVSRGPHCLFFRSHHHGLPEIPGTVSSIPCHIDDGVCCVGNCKGHAAWRCGKKLFDAFVRFSMTHWGTDKLIAPLATYQDAKPIQTTSFPAFCHSTRSLALLSFQAQHP